MRIAACLLLFLRLQPEPAWSEARTGSLYGGAFEEQGAPRAGIEVTLSAPGQEPRVQVTNEKGHYRFVAMIPGEYRLEARMPDGYPYIIPKVVITAGRNTVVGDFLLYHDFMEYLECMERTCCDHVGCIPVLLVEPSPAPSD